MNNNKINQIDVIKRHESELLEICEDYNLNLYSEVLSKRRDSYIQEWRYECYKLLKGKNFTHEVIWKAFNKHHTAITYTIKTYSK